MADKEIAVKVQDLTKSFKIPLEASSGIKQKLINILKGRKGYREFTPLSNVSFEIEKGDFFGIVGRNGSGKSTLLKTIAGIYTPDKGLIRVNGKLVPFIELGVGFNPELTGRENVYLNGALLGFSHKEMEAMYDEIIDFAEIGEFMNEKLKNYSSGMQVRLAFSIAIKAEGNILLLDEVLAVGDEAFQKKCISYFSQLKRNKQTVVLVTHDMTNIEKFCNKVLILDKGGLVGLYSASQAQNIYRQLNREDNTNQKSIYNITQRWGDGESSIEWVAINGKKFVYPNKNNPILIKKGEGLKVAAKVKSNHKREVVFGIGIHNEVGEYIAGPNTEEQHFKTNSVITYEIEKLPLNPDVYSIELSLFSDGHECDHILNAAKFEVLKEENKTIYGKVDLYGKWRSE